MLKEAVLAAKQILSTKTNMRIGVVRLGENTERYRKAMAKLFDEKIIRGRL